VTLNCNDLKSVVTTKDNEITDLKCALRTRKMSTTVQLSSTVAGVTVSRHRLQTSKDGTFSVLEDTSALDKDNPEPATRSRVPSASRTTNR